MIDSGTWETGEEINIYYEREQRLLYERKDSNCIYDQFERQVGINKGNFVEMVAKKFFRDDGYNVESYYYLVRNRIKRERMPGFKIICQTFGEKQVQLLIEEADNVFRSLGKRIASGDPDLFIYRNSGKESFFVEVKENDQITANQKLLFPIIQKYLCPVYIARVSAKL